MARDRTYICAMQKFHCPGCGQLTHSTLGGRCEDCRFKEGLNAADFGITLKDDGEPKPTMRPVIPPYRFR